MLFNIILIVLNFRKTVFTNLINMKPGPKWGFTALWWKAEVLTLKPLMLYWRTLEYQTHQTHSKVRRSCKYQFV